MEPRLGLLELVEEDLNNMGVRNWTRRLHDRDQWRTNLEDDEVIQDCNARRRWRKIRSR